MIKRALTLIFLVMLNGCTSKEGTYSIISSRPMNLYTLTANNELVAENVSTSVSKSQFLILPIGDDPKIGNAVEELVQKYQGDYMTNIEISYHTIRLLPLYSKNTWVIKGDVMRVLK